MKDTYRTIKAPSRGIFKERGSKFLAFAYPVYSMDEVNEILLDLRREYHDARHHCYACCLGAARETCRANDGGEPSNSAGMPILGQIRAFDMSNVLVVVVRYFGGTLLGVGGLIRAYRSAASDALENAEIIRTAENELLYIHFPYKAIDHVMRVMDREGLKIVKREFSESCIIRAAVRKSHRESVVKKFRKIQGVKVLNSY